MIGIRTLLCAASAACGLTLGLNVQAATVTLDMPGCNSFGFDGTTLTCNAAGGTQAAPACSISGPTTGATGSTVTLQATCSPAASVGYAWAGVNCVGGIQSARTCGVTGTNNGDVRTATVIGTNAVGAGSPSAPYSVTFSDTPPPDTGGIPTTCPDGTKVVSTTINAFDGQSRTLNLGSGSSQTGIFKVVVPAGVGPNVSLTFLRAGGTTDQTSAVSYVSKTACDMPSQRQAFGTYPNQQWLTGYSSATLHGVIDGVSSIIRGTPLGDVLHMAPNDVWYLMFQNKDSRGRDTCKGGTCAVVIKPNVDR